MAFASLFSSVSIGKLELENRIMLPAMGTKFANEDRTVSKQLINYHVSRTKGGTEHGGSGKCSCSLRSQKICRNL